MSIPQHPRSRPARPSIENSPLLLLVFGAALGAVAGVALDLPDYWPVLPSILGAAVGLVAARDDPREREPRPGRRSPRHFGDPPP